MEILIGVVLLVIGLALIDREDNTWKIGAVAIALAIAILIFAIFAYRQVEAQGGETRAGISLHMEQTLHKALIAPVQTKEIELTTVAREQIDDTNPNITEEEIELLAKAITAEVGTTDERRAYLTGSVILNRVQSDKFPNSIYEVLHQQGQYECVSNGHINREYTDVAWKIAEQLLTYGVEDVPEDVVYQAEFEQGSGVYEQRGNTYFCFQ